MTDQTNEKDALLADDAKLFNYTQRKRLMLVDSLTAADLSDPTQAAAVGRILDGIDKQALTLRKLEIEQQGADADKASAKALTELTNNISKMKSNPFRATNVGVAPPTANLPVIDVPDDQLVRVAKKETHAEFINRMDKKQD